ncbi:MAG: hypothetical protein COB02_13140 [Candidatus Cloacimonadota bacterium]|nr:MAG: hypothetical protein COB02_13140 [Candidatus Cloacimonadota bacterium]
MKVPFIKRVSSTKRTYGTRPSYELGKNLKKLGIDLNQAGNRVFLPYFKSSKAPGAYHRKVHTNKYYKNVKERLEEANSKSEALEILNNIRENLLKDTFNY